MGTDGSERRVACYVRVSTEGQNEASQVEAIQRWLAGHGITDPLWFKDKATGRNTNRKGFAELQSAIFNGEVDTVVVYRLDRLSRSMRDGINILQDWLDAGVRLVATSQEIDYSGSTGKLIAGVLMAVSEMESAVRRERQAEGITAAKKRGVYAGRQPGALGKKTAEQLDRVRNLRKRGLSFGEIAKSTGLSKPTVARLLRTFDLSAAEEN